MKHLELHIIQSVPVACLNRDDLNSPKTAVFGGVQRARVSSQCWKRAIRDLAKESSPNHFKGDRTRRMVFALKKHLEEAGLAEPAAVGIAEQVASVVETLDSKMDADGLKKTKTLMFFSEAEYVKLAQAIAGSEEVKKHVDGFVKAMQDVEKSQKEKDKEASKKALKEKEGTLKAMGKVLQQGAIAKAIKAAKLNDAADIALFGRMVANDHSLTVEAAGMFSHALSTHKADNEIDFFAAVDDLQPKEESGAGMTSTLEFNSATYYRFAALNLDMLKDEKHLCDLTPDQRQAVVRTFVEATIMAIPSARRNTMNANTLPSFVLAVVRDKGHPIQLANAFENPVRSQTGYAAESIKRLEAEYEKLKDTWGIDAVLEKRIPEVKLATLLKEVVKHVD
ncbi:type I-E CRISPR-associated protein Cas7/Cse4/CasC [Planctomycetota bacterium]